MAGHTGFAPATFRVTVGCSDWTELMPQKYSYGVHWPEFLTWIALAIHAIALVKWFDVRLLMGRDVWFFGILLMLVLIFRLCAALAFYEGIHPRWSVGVLILVTAVIVFTGVLRLKRLLVGQREQDLAVESARQELAKKLSTEESLALQLAKQLANTREELDYYKGQALAKGAVEFSASRQSV